MAEPLEKLFELPAPEQAVVIARGPSLERYLPARHPSAVTIGVNDLGYRWGYNADAKYRVDYSIFIDGHLKASDGSLICELPKWGTVLRPKRHAECNEGNGYYWDWQRGSEDDQQIRDAFGRTGSAAMLLPWLWGCRDIWIYGMDSYPDCNDNRSAIGEGVHYEGGRSYESTVSRQKKAIEYFGMQGCVHWAHLERF